MNYNKHSVLLATLKLKGPLTRPHIWAYVENFKLYSGSTNLKSWLKFLVEEDRVVRKCKQIGATQKFEYFFNDNHPNNKFHDQVFDRIKDEIESFESIVEATKKERKL